MTEETEKFTELTQTHKTLLMLLMQVLEKWVLGFIEALIVNVMLKA